MGEYSLFASALEEIFNSGSDKKLAAVFSEVEFNRRWHSLVCVLRRDSENTKPFMEALERVKVGHYNIDHDEDQVTGFTFKELGRSGCISRELLLAKSLKNGKVIEDATFNRLVQALVVQYGGMFLEIIDNKDYGSHLRDTQPDFVMQLERMILQGVDSVSFREVTSTMRKPDWVNELTNKVLIQKSIAPAIPLFLEVVKEASKLVQEAGYDMVRWRHLFGEISRRKKPLIAKEPGNEQSAEALSRVSTLPEEMRNYIISFLDKKFQEPAVCREAYVLAECFTNLHQQNLDSGDARASNAGWVDRAKEIHQGADEDILSSVAERPAPEKAAPAWVKRASAIRERYNDTSHSM